MMDTMRVPGDGYEIRIDVKIKCDEDDPFSGRRALTRAGELSDEIKNRLRGLGDVERGRIDNGSK